MEIALNVDERGTEFQTATRTKLQISGASIARTILTTSKIAAKGTLTQRSPQQDLKMTLVVSFVFTMKDQESRGELTSNLLVDTYLVPRVLRNMSAGRENGTLIVPEWRSASWWQPLVEKSGNWKSFISQSIQIQPYMGIFLSGSAASDIFTVGVPSFSILALKLCFESNC